MRRKYPRSFALILSLAVICIGRANPTSIESHQDQTVKIGVTLVQVDAVVTDDHGNPVRDLKPEDFEVFEDGHKQRISNFSFINTLSSPAQPHPAAVKPPDKSALYIPPPNLLPEQVKRTIALVVDDLSMSPSSIIETKQALKKFVSDRMEPGDLVAVIRTGGGMGALQQFTSDKRRLYAAIDRIWWNPFGNGGISAVPAIGGAPIRAADINVPPDNLSSGFSGDDRQIAEESRRQIFAAGTLGAVNYVVKGLAELPGRKSVVLMSEGFPVNYERGRDTRIFDLLRQLADLANRASVVVYTIDPRGLVDLGLTAADDVGRMTPQEVERSLDARSDAFRQSQEALLYLAAETGGLAVRNSNDIVRGLDRVMNDQNGYYLIGFIPDEKTFKTVNGARPFHDVKVSVKRAGLHVRYHHGFYGISDQEIHAVPQTRAQQMAAALISPFSSGGISVKLTSLFSTSKKSGRFVRSLVHIDARSLTFFDDGAGWHQAVIDLVVIAFGDNGRTLGQLNKTLTIRAKGDEYRAMMDRGLVYNINLPVKKEGAYQVRFAVRDATSKKIGSGSQFLNIPNINKGRLALSGIVLTGLGSIRQTAATSQEIAKAQQPVQAIGAATSSREPAEENHNAPSDDSPAVRRFSPGERLDLGFIVFNAKLDKSTRKPGLKLQMRVFKDGDLVTEGPSIAFDPGQPSDPERVGAGGTLALNSNMAPGHYAVQVVCTDLLASVRHQIATSWMDFEIK